MTLGPKVVGVCERARPARGIQHSWRAGAVVHESEEVSSEAALILVGDRENRAGGNGGIDCGASVLEDGDASGRGQMVDGGDHPMRSEDGAIHGSGAKTERFMTAAH